MSAKVPRSGFFSQHGQPYIVTEGTYGCCGNDAYRTDFRRFPILDMNRKNLVDHGLSLSEKRVRVDLQKNVDLDRSPVINLCVRVKERPYVWELMV